MWARIAVLILRNRLTMLAILAILTAFWAWMAISRIHLNHKFQTMLPEKDSVNLVFQDMKNRFGEDGMVVVIGVNEKELFKLEKFNAWKKMGDELKLVDGIDSVFSVAHMYALVKNDSLKKFDVTPLTPTLPTTQTEVDSINYKVHQLPFYDGMLYNDSTNASLMMVFVNPQKFNSEDRGTTIDDLLAVTEKYKGHFSDLHFSGMPYIRHVLFKTLRSELKLFVALSALVTALIIFIFFKSIRVIIACMIVVGVGVTWSFGTIGILGYDVSQLMALIPPLMIVIAIPNCIYLITKYHQEFNRTGNKMRALSGVIQKIGIATFMTNATTALGFGTFIFTRTDKLVEFGVIASINVMSIFILSIIIIPIVFSYMKDPSVKQTKHLEKKWVNSTIEFLVSLVTRWRWAVYLGTGIIVAIGIYGITFMKTTGAITEDLPSTSTVKIDLDFIETNFGGMIPFEIIIDFKKKGQIQKERNLQKIEAIQEVLAADTVFSKSLSIVDATKFVNQAFFGGDPEKFEMIERSNMAFIKPYFDSLKLQKGAGIKGFVDSTETRARITTQVKDLGAKDLTSIEDRLTVKVDSILNPNRKEIDSVLNVIFAASGVAKDSLLFTFYENESRIYALLIEELANNDSLKIIELENDPTKIYAQHGEKSFDEKLRRAVDQSRYKAIFTGTAIAYAKGTHYLITNLLSSLVFAILSISALMALLFRSFRMVAISMIPNLVPLIVTAAIMGFFEIPMKPSTILVFSIALGISVDDAIHFLAKYRQDLKLGKSIGESAIGSIRESGVSMMYTSIVLFCGFMMFTFSEFGGTVALGLLVSITLFVAMFCNLIILPSLLMTLDKLITTKAFREPYMEIYDEEVDEELSEIQIEKKD